MNELKVLKFGAVWCGPCKRLEPILENLKSEFSDIKFEHIDVDENSDMARKFNVSSIPTLIFLRDDSEVKRIVGLQSENQLKKLLQEFAAQ